MAGTRQWRADNRPAVTARQRELYWSDPDKHRQQTLSAYHRRHRAALDRAGWRCTFCGMAIDPGKGSHDSEGPTLIGMAAAHRLCNLHKRAAFARGAE